MISTKEFEISHEELFLLDFVMSPAEREVMSPAEREIVAMFDKLVNSAAYSAKNRRKDYGEIVWRIDQQRDVGTTEINALVREMNQHHESDTTEINALLRRMNNLGMKTETFDDFVKRMNKQQEMEAKRVNDVAKALGDAQDERILKGGEEIRRMIQRNEMLLHPAPLPPVRPHAYSLSYIPSGSPYNGPYSTGGYSAMRTARTYRI